MLAGGVVVEQVGRGLADALPEAFGVYFVKSVFRV